MQVSVACIKLLSLDGKQTIMRHSTTRIAYSTVDAENPKLFSYVGMVKDTQLTLCHIFKCKTPKQGYEMTFVCAQAFDLNFRTWQSVRRRSTRVAEAPRARAAPRGAALHAGRRGSTRGVAVLFSIIIMLTYAQY